jgi:hypothetical protein
MAVAALGLLTLAACRSDAQGSDADPAQVDATAAPVQGACRNLTPDDLDQHSNATRTVPCTQPHTAQTFAVGTISPDLEDAAYDDAKLDEFGHRTCQPAFATYVGADESLAMRTTLGWTWFRPSKKAWEAGARWYRCDVVGGGPVSEKFADLPTTTRQMLVSRPDAWMVCADGPTVAESKKVACTEPHGWRAVTTIKLGEPTAAYPGDDAVKARTDQFCSESVGAWLGYPSDYGYGYTWFGADEWAAGNRRSVCWARTER